MVLWTVPGGRTLLRAAFVLACSTLPTLAQHSKEVELHHWVDFPIKAPNAAAAIYGRLIERKDGGSDVWPNKAAIKAVIEQIRNER